jgi:hypothetical protein
MLDADSDAACELGPRLVAWAREWRHDFEIGCVLIVVEYETWFVGGAESLRVYIACPSPAPENPEDDHHGKGWIRQYMRGPSYSETIDQPAMTAALDLNHVRARCPSFARLCRIIEDHVASE